MKKAAIIILISIIVVVFLNVGVTTRQGIDFRVHEIKIPIYLKALDYVDRHFNYRELVRTIVAGAGNDEEKVLKIFNWVHANIRHTPPDFPIVDDHPLNIIIRGCGVKDQLEDIFTVLCYYSGTRAFFVDLKNSKGKNFQISFVKLRRGWSPMSAYFGIYIKKEDRIATLKDIADNPSLISLFAEGIENFETKTFFDFVNSSPDKEYSIRTTAQSPFGRLIYYIQRFFLRKRLSMLT